MGRPSGLLAVDVQHIVCVLLLCQSFRLHRSTNMGNNIHNVGASRPKCVTTISFPATSMSCFCIDMIRGLFTVYWMYSSVEWCTLTPIEWLLNYCHHVQTDWYPKSQCQSNKRCLLLKQICSRCSNLDPWTHSYVQFQWDSDHSNGRKLIRYCYMAKERHVLWQSGGEWWTSAPVDRFCFSSQVMLRNGNPGCTNPCLVKGVPMSSNDLRWFVNYFGAYLSEFPNWL
jgi:hypothetical protein